jgi:intracellular septation protein
MQKLFFDLFPVVLFFIAYKMYDIYTATAVIIGSSAFQLLWLKIRKKPIEKTYIITFLAILVLGGLTLALHNAEFIKWKPTIVNWALAIAFLVSEYVGSKSLLKKMMETALDMNDTQWKQLNLAWIVFFIACGILNLAVAYTCTENTWVNFKLFGLTALSLVFMVTQIWYLRPYLRELEEDGTVEKSPVDAETLTDA